MTGLRTKGARYYPFQLIGVLGGPGTKHFLKVTLVELLKKKIEKNTQKQKNDSKNINERRLLDLCSMTSNILKFHTNYIPPPHRIQNKG